MLAVPQGRNAIRGFAGLQQQRIAAPPHEGIRTEHRAQSQGAAPNIAGGHRHRHAFAEGVASPARPTLMVDSAGELEIGHQHPAIGHGHPAHRWRQVGLPARPGGIAIHGISTEIAVHGHFAHGRLAHICLAHVHPIPIHVLRHRHGIRFGRQNSRNSRKRDGERHARRLAGHIHENLQPVHPRGQYDDDWLALRRRGCAR